MDQKQAQQQAQQIPLELQRHQLVMEALAAQRSQAQDALAMASAEVTLLTSMLKTAEAQRDEAKKLAKQTLETAHALCRAYDAAVEGNADGCPDGDPQVNALREKLGYKGD